MLLVDDCVARVQCNTQQDEGGGDGVISHGLLYVFHFTH